MLEVQYALKNDLSYTNKGDVHSAKFITIKPPSFQQMPHFTPIKQALMAAINEISTDSVAEKKPDSTDDGINGKQVMQLLHNWSGELTKIMLHAKELFRAGAAEIDGEVLMTAPLVDKMSMDDFEGLLGCYIANFIVPSLMDGQ